MKEWLTAREIAELQLPDLPTSERGVRDYALRSDWDEHPSFSRRRAGRDGGGGTEYHVNLLPVLAKVAYQQKHLVVEAPRPEPAGKVQPQTAVSARAAAERDARLAIVATYQKFQRGAGLKASLATQVFVDRYNAELIAVDPWVREIVPSLSKRTLIRWRTAKSDGRGEALAVDRGAARKGTGVLDTANEGRVKAFALALIAQQPHLSAAEVRTQCEYEFGEFIMTVSKGVETAVELPPVRTFQHFLKTLKETHRIELTKLTNPDLFRSTMALSGTGTLRHVSEPNQLWQIDASPVDALCSDGRHSIYVCVDIATRRMVLSVSRTPRASAVALLIRKAILAWGAPEVIKTDNGSDFTARDTTRLFASLGIEAEKSDAYSPQQKGHVERAIRTFQHNVGPLLPGYIGHSVADRKRIEERRSFAERLGESEAETFSVSLSGADLQKHVDEWAELVYQHRPHAGLKQQTPFNAALASTVPARMVDERALDLLLMPVAGGDGRRVVTKFGVRIDHHYYLTPTIMPETPVFVRQDPNDLGRAYCFAEDGGTFLGEAICPELRGIHPQTFVQAAKELQSELLKQATRQIKADMKEIAKGPALIERSLEVARRNAPNVIPLPKRTETHSTPQISAAIEAMGERLNPTRALTPAEAAEHRRLIAAMEAEDEAELFKRTDAIIEERLAEIEAKRRPSMPEGVVALPETPRHRYRRALTLSQAMHAGQDIGFEAYWLGRYEQSAEFKAQARLHEEYGDAYLS